MDSLSPPLQITLASLLGLYLGWVVVAALRTGTIRYRTRVHAKGTEPKTYWATVAWFGLLAATSLGYALWQVTATP